MRKNTADIIASPEFSIVKGDSPKNTYAKLYFSSVSAAHAYAIIHARTDNERSWISSSSFLGSNKQSMADIDATGKATYPLECVKKAIASMDKTPTKPGRVQNVMVGGFYDVPSVISGLPLAARSRVKTKLKPLILQIAVDFSSSVTAEFMAPITARIAKALNDYTISGGVVTLSLCSINFSQNPAYPISLIETKVNAADIASIAFAFSPVFMRGIMYPVASALSVKDRDTLPMCYDKPLPNAYYLTGSNDNIAAAATAIITALRIA